MNEIKIIVVDDEKLAREGISLLLSSDEHVKVIKECINGEEAVQAITELKPDLIFLDVQMPHVNGFEVVRALRIDKIPAIIFVTAFDKHALEAFEVNAIDYLLKPFTDERFFKALERAKLQIRNTTAQKQNDTLAPLLNYLESKQLAPKYLKSLMVKEGGRIIFLQTSEIIWIEAADYYVILHLNGVSHVIRETLSYLEENLDPELFSRVHRSSIVNIKYIKEIQPYGKEDFQVLLLNGNKIKMGKSWLKKLESKSSRYF
jgi:two-component system LytT family response regulator